MSVILCDRGDEYKVIEEEKEEWIRDVLIALGVDEKMFNTDIDETDFREYLDVREIEIWKNLTSGKVEIFRKDKLVAEWKSPKLVLIKDKPNKLYYEISLNEWALPFQMSGRGEVNE